MTYLLLILKTVHILSAVLFLGFGLASFFYKALAFRSGDPKITAWCDRQIVLADWIFTVPSGVLLPLTGSLLVVLSHYSWSFPWVRVGIAGFALAGFTWLPAAVLQIRMRRSAEQAVAGGTALPEVYGRWLKIWALLGVPSFLSTLIVVWAMVARWAAFG